MPSPSEILINSFVRRNSAVPTSSLSLAQEKEPVKKRKNGCKVAKGSKEVARVPCGHEFHLQCILRWAVAHNACPICRAELYDRAAVEGGSGHEDTDGPSPRTANNYVVEFNDENIPSDVNA